MLAGPSERVCRVVRSLLARRHPGAPLSYTSSGSLLTGLERVADLATPALTVDLLQE